MVGFIAARAELLDGLFPPGPPSQAPVAGPTYDDTALVSGLEAFSARLADLEAAVAALPEPQPPVEQSPPPEVDLSAINAEIAALSDQVAALANQPVAPAPVPTEAIDAAMAGLRATAAEQQAEIDRLLADARLVRNDAEAAATATLARAAMTRILSAVDSGAPFGAALGDLEQAGAVDVPAQLRDAAESGVPSLAQIQETVPDAARAALAAARGMQGDTGIGGFLQRQLGARSIEPREGSDPDAVLSRIEAAVRAGRLGDALAEAETLPAPAQEAMATWIEQAQSRHDAVSAANALAERLSAF
jgi:hypothetical protein